MLLEKEVHKELPRRRSISRESGSLRRTWPEIARRDGPKAMQVLVGDISLDHRITQDCMILHYGEAILTACNISWGFRVACDLSDEESREASFVHRRYQRGGNLIAFQTLLLPQPSYL
jgi:hypothetical protein